MAGTGEWYEVVAFFREDELEVLGKDDQKTFVHGKIGDVVIAQIEVAGQTSVRMQQSMMAAKKALEAAGIKTALIMPEGIRLMKFQRVDEARSAELAAQFAADGDETVVH